MAAERRTFRKILDPGSGPRWFAEWTVLIDGDSLETVDITIRPILEPRRWGRPDGGKAMRALLDQVLDWGGSDTEQWRQAASFGQGYTRNLEDA